MSITDADTGRPGLTVAQVRGPALWLVAGVIAGFVANRAMVGLWAQVVENRSWGDPYLWTMVGVYALGLVSLFRSRHRRWVWLGLGLAVAWSAEATYWLRECAIGWYDSGGDSFEPL